MRDEGLPISRVDELLEQVQSTMRPKGHNEIQIIRDDIKRILDIPGIDAPPDGRITFEQLKNDKERIAFLRLALRLKALTYLPSPDRRLHHIDNNYIEPPQRPKADNQHKEPLY